MSALVDFATRAVAIRPQFELIIGSKSRTKAQPKPISNSLFVALISLLIASAMVGAIFLQALVAKSAFYKVDLVKQRTQLVAERSYLIERAAQLESPVVLRKKAQQLGMITPERPTYLRLADQKLLDGRRSR